MNTDKKIIQDTIRLKFKKLSNVFKTYNPKKIEGTQIKKKLFLTLLLNSIFWKFFLFKIINILIALVKIDIGKRVFIISKILKSNIKKTGVPIIKTPTPKID